MAQDHQRIGILLIQLEDELRHASLWGEVPPSDEALASRMPFCYDRMAFEQWLQWIFIPRIAHFAGQRFDFPGKCEVAPMAEVRFEQQRVANAVAIVRILHELDQLLSA